jgi:E3 ubiquitin-protein ligase MYCBP2
MNELAFNSFIVFTAGMDGGLALLRSPSKALQDTVKLISSLSDQIVENKYASLPVLDFVTRHHNLESLRISMELALRKAACRVFAMEVFFLLPKQLIHFFRTKEVIYYINLIS